MVAEHKDDQRTERVRITSPDSLKAYADLYRTLEKACPDGKYSGEPMAQIVMDFTFANDGFEYLKINGMPTQSRLAFKGSSCPEVRRVLSVLVRDVKKEEIRKLILKALDA